MITMKELIEYYSNYGVVCVKGRSILLNTPYTRYITSYKVNKSGSIIAFIERELYEGYKGPQTVVNFLPNGEVEIKDFNCLNILLRQ